MRKWNIQRFGGSQFQGLFFGTSEARNVLLNAFRDPHVPKTDPEIDSESYNGSCGNPVDSTRKKCGQATFLYTQFIQKTTPQISSKHLIHRFIPGLSADFPLSKNIKSHLLSSHLSTLSTMPITTTMYK